MSNPRNTQALESIISQLTAWRSGDEHTLARWLTANGILVPSVMTREDIESLALLPMKYSYDADDLTLARQGLEKIAKGVA